VENAREKETLGADAELAHYDPSPAPAPALKPFELAENQVIEGRYRVIGLLGEGGMGAVYKVEQMFLKKEQALKTLSAGRMSDVAWRRFQKEATAASLLDHPGLIKVQDFGLIGDTQPFFVMDLAQGETLAAIIRRCGPLPLDMVLVIFRQICLGMGYAHKKHVIHRDIKPSNIMVSNYGDRLQMTVKIVDFGIAKQLNMDDADSLTRTGEVFGTPYYMSPEQCLGRTVDDRSDAYSVGCVLFEALTGLPPLIGDTALGTMMKHQSEKPPSLKEATLGKEFPDDLERVVAKLLAKDPRSRYNALEEVTVDLDRIADNKPVLLGGKPPMPTPPPSRFEKFQQVIFALLILVLGIVSGYFIARLTEKAIVVVPAAPPAPNPMGLAGMENSRQEQPKSLPAQLENFSSNVPDGKWRLFHFGNISLGEIFAINDKGSAYVYRNGKFIKEGENTILIGEVLINKAFVLRASPLLTHNAPYFRRFRADEISGVDFDEANADLTDEQFQNLDHLSGIMFLRVVTPNSLDGKAISTINEFPNLTTLALRSFRMTTADLLRVNRLQQLENLELHDFKDIDPLLDKLVSSSKLKALALDNCGITANIKRLASIKQLVFLDLRHNAITDNDLKCLLELPNLRELNLGSCPKLSMQCVATLKRLPITSLRMSHRAPAEENTLKKELRPIRIKFLDDFGHHVQNTDVNELLARPE
jgi:serine/threonine protein kinase